MINIYFIAIGGSVMHQLAIALHKKGYRIRGSDDEIFEPARTNLEKEGLLPAEQGWFPQNITAHIDAVILGMHAKHDNAELKKAKELNLKIYSFPEYIYEESRSKTRIVVGGSHGKTTVTSMIMHVFKESGKQFDYLVGAKLAGFAQSVQITDAPVIVCEGDEYPASTLEKRPKFHFLSPHIAILTGIAWDHINVFPTFDFYLEQFAIFIQKIESGGVLIYNETDPVLQKLVVDNQRCDISYKAYTIPQHEIHDGITTVSINNIPTPLLVFGDHNLLNLEAAYLACTHYGITTEVFVKAISHFKGASKRLEVIAASNTVTVFRDFAHAPSKVKATIAAVKGQFPNRTLFAILELHTYSSLNKNFMDQYKGSLHAADKAVVFYSKHALSLKGLPDLLDTDIQSGFGNSEIKIINDKQQLENWLSENKYDNVAVLFMSSGTYDGLLIDKFAYSITK